MCLDHRVIELVIAISFVFAGCTGNNGLSYVDPLIGMEGEGSEYGGLMPYV